MYCLKAINLKRERYDKNERKYIVEKTFNVNTVTVKKTGVAKIQLGYEADFTVNGVSIINEIDAAVRNIPGVQFDIDSNFAAEVTITVSVFKDSDQEVKL